MTRQIPNKINNAHLLYSISLDMMQVLYDFKPTIIEKKYLQNYVLKAMDQYNYAVELIRQRKKVSLIDPIEEVLQCFFMELYGFDHFRDFQLNRFNQEDIKDYLFRKQEQYHLLIDFSTDLESRIKNGKMKE